MGWKATIRAMEAAERHQQRDAKKRQRELERRAKEIAKLSALDQARLEVDTYENALEVLLSVHKEQAEQCDWMALLASLPPVPPVHHAYNELKARRHLAVTDPLLADGATVQKAQQQDELDYQEALRSHASDHEEWQKASVLARRILVGEPVAYLDAIEEFGPFAEIASIGSSLSFTVHGPRMVEVVLNTDGPKVIPSEVKSFTASGKVSVKAMPRGRFVELYQDYVCGCVLRVARELFALLPIDTVLVTASAEILDASTGQTVPRPILSVAMPRSALKGFNFDRLDPSDAVMGFTHRGDLRASRKTGEFERIVPMTVANIAVAEPERTDFSGLLASVRRMRGDLVAQCDALNPEATGDSSTEGGN